MGSKSKLLTIFFGLFALYAVAIGLYLWLASIDPIPDFFKGTAADPATFLTDTQLQQSVIYSALRNWIFFVRYPWEWAIYLVLLFTGTAGRWQDKLAQASWSGFVRFPVFVLLLSLVSYAALLPLRLISYALARHYGISTQPVWSWIRDHAVTFAIDLVILTIVSSVAFWFIRRGGRWWLRLWVVSVPFILIMMYIQPVVIDPLYNEFSRLSNPQLEQRILALADKADIPADRVYEVNVSEKTNALNAYVNGIGTSLRIVLWDTTLQKLDENETLLIMAHEMGHYVMRHLEWSAFGAVASSFFLLWFGSKLYKAVLRRWGPAWGIRKAGDVASLPVLLLIISLLNFAFTPAANFVSRQAERSADDYAIRLIGNTEGAVTMYQKLAISSLSEMNPPLLVKLFRSTHPSLMERIAGVQNDKQS
ncbi:MULTISPECIES: M48 family metallopeptidase [unclassified Paenibacillus]|uniref:M48 family metallopeptidase n=1 Tax=unclassified Paenibacillus TaxID=185978 RepID=UPI001AE6C0E5|nr:MULTISPECIES: M48 family metallopeptidase [unclassified Paenibacillus]MBP1155910.1 Zn-dependent protease with chaperone function [Paenibacillus sp. PvP091]MBP1168704.1 Zn-dependent protease with chaperone function [Paenibacillus sp. PvR098]MBP2439732.1 Zn-dependent protease with chaperone function [Paenibacillus sp. PvP052]